VRRAGLAIALLAAGCSGGGGASDDAPGDGGGTGDDGGPDGDGGGGGIDAADGEPSILYQCTPFDGGLCVMAADGTGPMTLHPTGFAPRGLADGSILFHTAGYRVSRRDPGGGIDDLGDGAFPRPAPGGRIVFQCTGLGGGICSMAADGSDRDTVAGTGRVPDVDAAGTLLFHSDAYHVIRRTAAGVEDDLGLGAFPVWTDDGDVLFQCDGLDGGLCRMAADGSGRTPLEATGRVPDARGDGDLVFHADDYTVSRRSPSGDVTPLRAGANAVWWD
jgi:hypothetical protein